MATVRIYKVAELLGLSSQDAMDLLKKETGIDVKSASMPSSAAAKLSFIASPLLQRLEIRLRRDGPAGGDTRADMLVERGRRDRRSDRAESRMDGQEGQVALVHGQDSLGWATRSGSACAEHGLR